MYSRRTNSRQAREKPLGRLIIEWRHAAYRRAEGRVWHMNTDARGTSLREYCVENCRADLLQQWNCARNGGLTPDTVTVGSRQKVWWIDRLGHEWQQAVYNRTALGRGCPVCAGREVRAGVNDLASTHPHLAAQWDRDKNGALAPQQVTAGSSRKVWWRCEK